MAKKPADSPAEEAGKDALSDQGHRFSLGEDPATEDDLNVPLGGGTSDPAGGAIRPGSATGPAPVLPPLPNLFQAQIPAMPSFLGGQAASEAAPKIPQHGRTTAVSDEQLGRNTFADLADDVFVDFIVYYQEDDGEYRWRGKLSNILASQAKEKVYDIPYGGEFAFRVLHAEKKTPLIPLKKVFLPGPKPTTMWRFGAKMITKEEISQGVAEALRNMGFVMPGGPGQVAGVPNPVYSDVAGNLRHDLAEARTEATRLRDKIEAKDGEIRRVELEKVALAGKVAQLESDLRRAESDAKAAESEIADLREKIEKLPRDSEASSTIKVMGEVLGKALDGHKKDDGSFQRDMMAQYDKNLDRVLEATKKAGGGAFDGELPRIVAGYTGLLDSYKTLADARLALTKTDVTDRLLNIAEKNAPAIVGNLGLLLGGGKAASAAKPEAKPAATQPAAIQSEKDVPDSIKARILGMDIIGRAWDEVERRPAPALAATILRAAMDRIKRDGMIPHLDQQVQTIVGMLMDNPLAAMIAFSQRVGMPVDYAQEVGKHLAALAASAAAQAQAPATAAPTPELPAPTTPPAVAPTPDAQAPVVSVADRPSSSDGKTKDGGAAVVGEPAGGAHAVRSNGGRPRREGVQRRDPKRVRGKAVQDGGVDRSKPGERPA